MHTYFTSTHAHTQTHTHTQTATQFNILPLQILRINKQLEEKKNNNNKSKLCLRTHWMRWLVVLLSKHTQEDPRLHASSYHDYYTYIHTIRIIKPFFFFKLLSLKYIVEEEQAVILFFEDVL